MAQMQISAILEKVGGHMGLYRVVQDSFLPAKACLDQMLATTLQIEAMQQLCRMQHW